MTIRLKAVGDICPGDKYIEGLGVLHTTRKYGPGFPFEKIADQLQTADVVIANFEGLLSRKVFDSEWTLTFCGEPDFAKCMKTSGISVVNLANNHTLEHGPELFRETVRHLEDAGIRICGLKSKSKDFYSEPVFLEISGKRIGIIAYNWIGGDGFETSNEYIAQSSDSQVNYTWDRQIKPADPGVANKNVIKDLKQLSRQVDISILVTHWGYEFLHLPPKGVIREAKSFIDAGADIILGGHPHVIQGYEIHKGKPVFYSLGNFIFDQRDKIARYSCMLDMKIDPDSDRCEFNIIPVFINRQFQPEVVSGAMKNHILSILRKSCEEIEKGYSNPKLSDDVLYSAYEQLYGKGKLKKIVFHFLAVFDKPKLIMLILRKIVNSLDIILRRFKGERVRW